MSEEAQTAGNQAAFGSVVLVLGLVAFFLVCCCGGVGDSSGYTACKADCKERFLSDGKVIMYGSGPYNRCIDYCNKDHGRGRW